MQDLRHHGAQSSHLPGSWVVRAACGGRLDLEPLFFVERGASGAPAKAICRQCPVRMECLEFALSPPQMPKRWCVLSERERRRIIRTRRRAAAA